MKHKKQTKGNKHMERTGKYDNGSVVIHNARVWRVLGREQIQSTSHRRYVLQDVLDPDMLKLGRVDKLHSVAI